LLQDIFHDLVCAYDALPSKEKAEPSNEILEKDLDLFEDKFDGTNDSKDTVEKSSVNFSSNGADKVVNPLSLLNYKAFNSAPRGLQLIKEIASSNRNTTNEIATNSLHGKSFVHSWEQLMSSIVFVETDTISTK
jgi:hypothetical protein